MSQRPMSRWLHDALPGLLTRELIRQKCSQAAPFHCPDANALTAYVEKHLDGAEQNAIVEHLTGCETCRMTVMLAVRAGRTSAAAGSHDTLLGPLTVRTHFLPWATAGGVAAGLLAAFLLFWQQPAPPRLQPAAASMPIATQPAPRSLASTHAALPERVPIPLQMAKADAKAPVLTAAAIPVGHLPAGAMATQPAPIRQGFATLSASSRPVRQNESLPGLEVASTSLNSDGPSAAAPRPVASLSMSSPAPSMEASLPMAASFVGSPMVSGEAASTDPSQPSLIHTASTTAPARTTDDRFGFSRYLSNSNAAPAWRLSPAGVLEHTAGKGVWVRVPWQAGSKLVSLTVSGMHLWVGSQNGTLYHSADDGQSWHPVRIDLDGQALQDAIIGIHFSDQRQGELMTRSGARWFTLDGGHFWKPVILAPSLTPRPAAARR